MYLYQFCLIRLQFFVQLPNFIRYYLTAIWNSFFLLIPHYKSAVSLVSYFTAIPRMLPLLWSLPTSNSATPFAVRLGIFNNIAMSDFTFFERIMDGYGIPWLSADHWFQRICLLKDYKTWSESDLSTVLWSHEKSFLSDFWFSWVGRLLPSLSVGCQIIWDNKSLKNVLLLFGYVLE
jgi:hypothetical protein